jgi:hypothetical protein
MCLDLTFITVLLQQGFGLSPDKALHVSDVYTVTSKSVRKWEQYVSWKIGHILTCLTAFTPVGISFSVSEYQNVKFLI